MAPHFYILFCNILWVIFLLNYKMNGHLIWTFIIMISLMKILWMMNSKGRPFAWKIVSLWNPIWPLILVGEVWKTCFKTSSFGIKGVITLLQFLSVWTQLEYTKKQFKLGFFVYFFHHVYVVCIHVTFGLFSQLKILTKFYITSWVSPKWRGWYLCKPIWRWLKVW